MDNSMWIWIVIAIIVLLLIIGLGAMLSKGAKQRKIEHDRAEAERMRAEAAEREREVRERRADAVTTDADARAARAEADRASAEADRQAADAERRRVEAERLEGDARSRSEDAARQEREHEEALRAADAKDPDVGARTEGRHDDLGADGNPGDHEPDTRRDGPQHAKDESWTDRVRDKVDDVRGRDDEPPRT